MTSLPSPRSTRGDPSTTGESDTGAESPPTEGEPGNVHRTARGEKTERRKALARQLSDAVAARIRQLRVARNWSQEQLAKEAGLSKDAVSRIERLDRGAWLETLEQIANAFGVPLPQLLDVGQVPPASQEDERRARLLTKSLEQLPPWLAEVLPSAIHIIVHAVRKADRQSESRAHMPSKKDVVDPFKSAQRKHSRRAP